MKAAQAINKFKNSLAAIYYDVIIDNPYETSEDFAETIRLLLKFPKPRHFKLFSLTFYQEQNCMKKQNWMGYCLMKKNTVDTGKTF